MQDRPAQGVPPDGIQDGTAERPLGDSFLTGKRYPGEALHASPPPAPPARPPSRRRVFTRVVLPLLIFVAAIGVLAWVTQYLPSRPGPPSIDPNPVNPVRFTVKFLNPYRKADWEPERTQAEWDKIKKAGKDEGVPPKPSEYAAEYEVTTDNRQDGGHYDFEFQNHNSEPVAVGVESMTCQCSRVAVCALNGADWARYQQLKAKADPVTHSRENVQDGLPWKSLEQGEQNGVVVPGGDHGVVRIFWDGRNRQHPERVRLIVKVWVGPPGKFAERALADLTVFFAYVLPARFHPDRLTLGAVSPQNPTSSEVLYCWSATRDLEVVAPSPDPCFEVQARKLDSAEERHKLGEDLRAQGVWTRVRSAYRIEITVHEHRGGRQADLGAFHRTPALQIKSGGETLYPSLPVVRGRVQGDIKVGTFEDEGAMNLKSLKTNLATGVTGKLWTKPGVELEYEGFTPQVLHLQGVTLHKLKDDSLPNWTAWEVRMVVPAGLEPGPLPEDSAILLRVKSPTPRRIRIPLIGSAGRG